MIVAPKIIELSRSTKKKSAYMKIAIPDDLAQKIMDSAFSTGEKPLPVIGLGLEWRSLEK